MRGTTPIHLFRLPFDASLIKSVKITYSHDKTPVLVKETEDCTLQSNIISVKLTQEETLLFENNWLVDIQLRVLLENGDALRSDVFHRFTGVLLDEEVLK